LTALLELRKASGKSRAKVASDLQISERHLLRLENGTTPLARRWALAFAAYYGVEVDEIDEARP
jgi:transcriptional regulator with XRE-family HTH domain